MAFDVTCGFLCPKIFRNRHNAEPFIRIYGGDRLINASSRASAFFDRRVFIVEDEFLIALELKGIVEQLGCRAVGPVGSVDAALALLSSSKMLPDVALLDVNLREMRVTPVAQACRDLFIPFALVTAYGRLEFEEPLLQSAPRVRKPFDRLAIGSALAELLNATSER